MFNRGAHSQYFGIREGSNAPIIKCQTYTIVLVFEKRVQTHKHVPAWAAKTQEVANTVR